MIRLLIIGILTLTLLGGEREILSVEGGYGSIEAVSLPKGTSGIVVHHFDGEHSTIIARAILEAPDRIRFVVYDALAQPNLPKPKMGPQKGDTLILQYLYHRLVAIAPNYKSYEELRSKIDGEWIHPDLFAAELAKEKHPAPTRQDFRNFCNKFAVGRVAIILKERAHILDCYSFSTLQTVPMERVDEKVQKPFYTRITKIEGSLFNFFGPKEMEDYYTYYTRLMEGR
ncbi:MAG: hypothetical protein GXO19_02410 [Epsilonproteobacteria bacterium]|nr:hypothetical protein [Campylobacterota bacterium]